MASFIDKDGNQAVVDLTPAIYKEAKAAGLPLKAHINRKYLTTGKNGTAYDQFKASLGLLSTANNDFGLVTPSIADVLDGKTIQAGAVNTQTSGSPFGNESRTLFPSVVIDMIEAYVQKDRTTDGALLDGMIAYNQSISGANFEQPIINYTDIANNGPETARSQRIAQLASPPSMIKFTTTDTFRKIPTFSMGMEFSDQALRATTLDLIGLTLARFMSCENDARVYENVYDMINGELDTGASAVAAITSTSLDAAATGGVLTHKAWLKWLRQAPKTLQISHVICDIDSYLKVESRTGRPGSNNYDPTLLRIDPQAQALNPVVGGNVKFWIVDAATAGGPVAANTLVGLDARFAMARVRNLDADYQATEAFVMQRAQAMRIDSGMLMYRLQNQAWSQLTIS